MSKLLRGDELQKKCESLGIAIESNEKEAMGHRLRAHDAELQRRLYEYERDQRERLAWTFTFLSALASVVSAAVAIIVVLRQSN